MKEKVMEYPYQIQNIILDKASMSLIDLVNQRQIRTTQVNSIYRALNNKQHFDSMFVVNVINGTRRIRVIDGGHRTEALRKYFEKNPKEKIKVSMAVYHDLTRSQERQIYTKWNLGVKQTVDDFINSYKEEIPMYECMVENLPVSVYGSKNKLKLRYIVDAYLSSKQNPYQGGCGFGRSMWLDVLGKINDADVDAMKDTFLILDKTFNPDELSDFTRLPAYKFTNLKVLFRLIHINKVVLGKNYVMKRMKTTLYRKEILEQYKSVHRQGTIEAFNVYRSILNRGTKHQFK